MNYAPLTGAKSVKNINAGASPCAIICRPYGTRRLQKFHRTPIYINHELCYCRPFVRFVVFVVHSHRIFVLTTNFTNLHELCYCKPFVGFVIFVVPSHRIFVLTTNFTNLHELCYCLNVLPEGGERITALLLSYVRPLRGRLLITSDYPQVPYGHQRLCTLAVFDDPQHEVRVTNHEYD